MTVPSDFGGEPVTTHRVSPERLLAQVGGVSGVIYSSLPVVTFVVVSSLFSLLPAIASALGVAVLVLAWRLIRRESTQPALSGFIGVAVCALVAYVVGESKGYFLLGIWMSLLWAIVFAVSMLIRRPLVGYLWSWAGSRDRGWRDVPRAVYAFDIATLCWTLVFVARGLTPEGKVRFERRPVSVDDNVSGEDWPVLRGLEPGEVVVVDGALLLSQVS